MCVGPVSVGTWIVYSPSAKNGRKTIPFRGISVRLHQTNLESSKLQQVHQVNMAL